jgi:CRISPR system Cascade subunit CasD
MSTLLIRLAAPLQAWGGESKFKRRMTNREPTKSGVIGLIAAALGYGREDSIAHLLELKFAVRIDQVGEIIKDFHTAHTFGENNKPPFISDRYYLSDACFLVALEGPHDLLRDIEKAFQNPVFPIYLGRRSCPPTVPIVIELSDRPLLEALKKAPWQAEAWYRKKQPDVVRLEIVRDAAFDESGSFEVRDLPITFSQLNRKHAYRSAISKAEDAVEIKNAREQTQHNPFAGWEDENVSV